MMGRLSIGSLIASANPFASLVATALQSQKREQECVYTRTICRVRLE